MGLMARTGGFITVGALAAVAGVIGAISSGPGGAFIGAVVGAVTGYAIAFSGVRPMVAVSVAIGTVIGVVLGRSIVRVLCAPSGCPTVEWVTGVATGIGAFVGIGLVVALATRSFDEYNEALAAQRPPPEPGCEAEEDGHE